MESETEDEQREQRYEHIRQQAETLINRWRSVSYGIEPEAVLEAGLAATLQFLKAFHANGDRHLVMQAIGRLAQAVRPLVDPPENTNGAVPTGEIPTEPAA